MNLKKLALLFASPCLRRECPARTRAIVFRLRRRAESSDESRSDGEGQPPRRRGRSRAKHGPALIH